jgi:hypothetical protein
MAERFGRFLGEPFAGWFGWAPPTCGELRLCLGESALQLGDAILECDRWLAVGEVKKICLETDGMCGLEGLEQCDCREALCICSGDEQVGSVAAVVESFAI